MPLFLKIDLLTTIHTKWGSVDGFEYPEYLPYIEWSKISEVLNKVLRLGTVPPDSTSPIIIPKELYRDVELLYRAAATTKAILMDAYTVARMFRNFRNVKGKFSGEPENIIVYAGGFHTQRYERFVKELGFDVIYDSDLTNKFARYEHKCIDATELPVNLFD